MNLTEGERLNLVSQFTDIVNLVRSNDPKSLEKLRPIIPIYQLVMSTRADGSMNVHDRVVDFTYLNRKKHGKKRVYIAKSGSDTLYISYFSKRDVLKICRGDTYALSISKTFVDRWVITFNNYVFKDICQLMSNTVAIDTTGNRSNRPIEGMSPKEWTASEDLIQSVNRFRSIKANRHVYAVCLKKYSLTKGS